MKQIKRSDIPLLSKIKEKQNYMNHMQMCLDMDIAEPPEASTQMAYSLMEQIDTLNQLKRMESSIFNDKNDND
jgi:hypothetical protein